MIGFGWEAFLASHPPRHRTAILVLVEGGTMRKAGKRCGLKDMADRLQKEYDSLVLYRNAAASFKAPGQNVKPFLASGDWRALEWFARQDVERSHGGNSGVGNI